MDDQVSPEVCLFPALHGNHSLFQQDEATPAGQRICPAQKFQ